jgi:hypothetical protein
MPGPANPFDLRRPRPPAPPPPAASAQPAQGQRRSGPPSGFLPVGGVSPMIDTTKATPYVKQQLQKLGVAPGTPVPGNLAQIIQGIREESEDVGLPLPPDHNVGMPQVVDIDQLSPDQKSRVRAIIAEAADVQRRLAETAPIAGVGPGVNEAIQFAQQYAQQGAQPAINVVDDRPAHIIDNKNQAAAPHPSPTRAGSIPPGGAYVHRGRIDDIPPEVAQQARPAAATPPPPTPGPPPPTHGQAEPAPGTMTDTGAGDARFCPHCGWNQALVDGVEPTRDDKYGFLWSILGGPGRRFERAYPLMGGNVVLTFRTLSSEEADAALHQIALDYRAGRLAGNSNWIERWLDYRLAFSLAAIDTKGVGRTYKGPATLAEVEYDPPPGESESTPLPALWDNLMTWHLHHESLRRAASLAFASFTDLVKKLEAQYDNGDFWEGIEAHA